MGFKRNKTMDRILENSYQMEIRRAENYLGDSHLGMNDYFSHRGVRGGGRFVLQGAALFLVVFLSVQGLLFSQNSPGGLAVHLVNLSDQGIVDDALEEFSISMKGIRYALNQGGRYE